MENGEQIEAWERLEKLCLQARNVSNLDVKKELLTKFYGGVKSYYETYRTKFDVLRKPE